MTFSTRIAAYLVSVLGLASGAAAQTIGAAFSGSYNYIDLGLPAGVPANFGGVAFDLGDPDALYIGGSAETARGAVYRVPVIRDANQHITGFAAAAAKHADAPYIDGGLQFGPGGVLFYASYPLNELGQIKPGSSGVDKSVPLSPHGVRGSVGALTFIPAGYPSAGDLKLMSYNFSESYTATLVPDGSGTYDVSSVAVGSRIWGGPEGMFYVPPDSPGFTNFQSMIVCEYSGLQVSVYDIDGNGDPIYATRQAFMKPVTGPAGAAVDPVSGDFIFSTFGSGGRVLAVRGFSLPCGRVVAYGPGTAGTGGRVPVLSSQGCFARKQRVSIDVDDGLGGAPGALFASVQQRSIPVVGITLLVQPFLTVIHVLGGTPGVAGVGSFALPMRIPDRTALLNTDFYFQAVYLDPATPMGLSATAGMNLRVR